MQINGLSQEQIRLLRLRAQNLHPEAARSITTTAQVVSKLCGIQAQELPSATLAVRARSQVLTVEDVRRAREEQRSILLTWGMRGTRHLLATEDLGWLLPLFAPVFIRAGERRYRQLGLTQEIRTQAVKLMCDALARRGPLTRPELAEALAARGIPVEGQAIAHLVRYAALEGVICFGPERDGDLTYVLLEDWVQLEGPLEQELALAELSRRYLKAYGPATPEDLSQWSGLSSSQARAGFKAISNDLLEIADPPIWMLKEQAAWLDDPQGDVIIRLLPRFDVYLLGYQKRDLIVPEPYARRIHPGGGEIKSTLIVDGRAVGVWRSERKRNDITIVVEPFETLNTAWMPALEAEVQDIGRFLGQEARLHVESL
jgi:hypothetical protein